MRKKYFPMWEPSGLSKGKQLPYIFALFFILGYFFTGDGVYRTSQGYYQLTGRLDDVINISGHRLGTAEIEDVVVRGMGKLAIITTCS